MHEKIEYSFAVFLEFSITISQSTHATSNSKYSYLSLIYYLKVTKSATILGVLTIKKPFNKDKKRKGSTPHPFFTLLHHEVSTTTESAYCGRNIYGISELSVI